MPDLDATDLLVAAAIVEVRATTANAPHLRALADRLIAARDATGEPEPTDGPNGPQNATEGQR